MEEKLEEKQTKKEWMAKIVHELRTPVNGILGLTEELLKTDITPFQKEDLEFILRYCVNMTKLIDNFLNFSKIEAGKLILEKQEFNFRQFLKEFIVIYKKQIQAKGLELFICIGEGIPSHLIGDKLRLEQILNNLFSNAIKFTLKGYIYFRIEKIKRSEKEIELLFEIEDSGIGISKKECDCLFEDFSQANDSIAREFGGTGLGLIISKQLVELMNGTIGVESQRGKGSKFFFSVSFGLSKNKQDSDSKKWYKDRNKVVREKKGNRQLEQLKRYIELKEWKKAETLAGIIKHKIATQDEKLKQSIFRLELDLRKKDYDRAGKQMEQIISIARHKK